MPKTMIAELVPGQAVRDCFAITGLKLAPFRNRAGLYLDLRLADRTGEIPARMWEGAEEAAETIAPGTVALVEGRVDEYKGEKQLVLASVRAAQTEEYEHADFVRVASRPLAEMEAELEGVIAEVDSAPLAGLLGQIFRDPDFRDRFLHAPGAQHLHHACVGGLLQHTLAVAAICREAAAIHPELNRDLLLAGALLHDVGKVWELEGELAFVHTDAGRLLGHVVLTDRFVVGQVARREDFPPRLAELLTHMLLSHHGQLDWGAPIRPAIPEALALHYADNLDAKLQIAADFINSPGAREGRWTRWHPRLETRLYLGPIDAEEDSPG
jgi:3'-5' exoribonuclease